MDCKATASSAYNIQTAQLWQYGATEAKFWLAQNSELFMTAICEEVSKVFKKTILFGPGIRLNTNLTSILKIQTYVNSLGPMNNKSELQNIP